MFIKKDGVVGHWFRWHLLGAAMITLCTYIIFAIAHYVLIYFGLPAPKDMFDPHLLLITIPWGILKGDAWYEKDREANEKLPAPDAAGVTVHSFDKGTVV